MSNQSLIKSTGGEFSLFFFWYFQTVPQFFLSIYRGCQKVIWHFFSVDFLLKTLFQPWKRDITIAVNPSIVDYGRVFLDNIISRFMGFSVRLLTIFLGIFTLLVFNLFWLLLIILWYLLLLVILLAFGKSFLLLSGL